MAQLDRLSSLVSYVDMHANLCEDLSEANLVICGHGAQLQSLHFFTRPCEEVQTLEHPVAMLRLDLGGDANPLLSALPCRIDVDLDTDADLKAVAGLIAQESAARLCGGQFALERLCGVLLVSLLRQQIKTYAVNSGTLAGLAHPKLSAVLVAMHDQPGRVWRVDDFCVIAGMSRSQFMASFTRIVGQAPMAYLKSWRMSIARLAVLRGDRVKEVARRLGYRNADAFCRAFAETYGMAPTHFAAGQKAA